MKAEELRIGNIVAIKGEDETRTIYQIEHRYKDVYRINDINNNDSIEGCPLTEEWLLKLGFAEGASGYYFKGDIVISVDRQVYFGETEAWIAEIATVHQLQNLVHALTGEELTIKGE